MDRPVEMTVKLNKNKTKKASAIFSLIRIIELEKVMKLNRNS